MLPAERGYAIANFNRNQLRRDDNCGSPAGCFPSPDGVQKLYPDYDWGTIATYAQLSLLYSLVTLSLAAFRQRLKGGGVALSVFGFLKSP